MRPIATGVLMLLSLLLIAADADDPIVVTAAKLRKVGIDYDVRGRDLVRCTITRSSGEDRVDQAMCEFVRQCVADGHGRRREAQACVSDRIAALVDADMEAEDVVLVRPAALEQARQPVASVARPGPQISLPPVEAPSDAIIVNGMTDRIEPGLWQFEKGRAYSPMARVRSGRGQNIKRAPPGFSYTLCLSEARFDPALRQLLAGHLDVLPGRVKIAHVCQPAVVEAGQGRLMVMQSCEHGRNHPAYNLHGRLSPDNIDADMDVQVELPNGKPLAYRYKLNGRRIGECPPSRPEGAAGRD